jgi:hypothetical protein
VTTAAGRAALAWLLLLQAVRGSQRTQQHWPGCKPQSGAPAAARGVALSATTTLAAVAAQMGRMTTAAAWVSDRVAGVEAGAVAWDGCVV